MFKNFIDNDNNNIINKIKKLLYINNRYIKILKCKYFFKYCFLINKIKTEKGNISNNFYKKDKNKILLIRIKKSNGKKY